MLELKITGGELFDEQTQTFVSTEDVTLSLEHSLLSISKWESKFLKPFLSNNNKTAEEILGYIRCMIIDNEYDENTLLQLTQSNFEEINAYINSPQSATTFGSMPKRGGMSEVITAELIYYWMIAFTIPISCESWHINRLFSLIRICNIKNAKPQKMNRNEIAARNRAINDQRKQQNNTTG